MIKTAYTIMALGIALALAHRFDAGWAIGALYIMLALWYESIEPARRALMRGSKSGDG